MQIKRAYSSSWAAPGYFAATELIGHEVHRDKPKIVPVPGAPASRLMPHSFCCNAMHTAVCRGPKGRQKIAPGVWPGKGLDPVEHRRCGTFSVNSAAPSALYPSFQSYPGLTAGPSQGETPAVLHSAFEISNIFVYVLNMRMGIKQGTALVRG